MSIVSPVHPFTNQKSIGQIAIDLGAKPEEVKAKEIFKTFKGKFAPRDYQYVPLEEDTKSRCIMCMEIATCREVLVYKNFDGTETEDSTYKVYLCNEDRDRSIELAKRRAEAKASPYKDEAYVRFATYDRSKPSITKLEYEVMKAIEQSRRDASGKSEGTVTSTPDVEGTSEHPNQITS
jgi:hypothetical protein